jgi:hypothetical protein
MIAAPDPLEAASPAAKPAAPSVLTKLQSYFAARRKFVVAALTPLMNPAAYYLGGIHYSSAHVMWYLTVLGWAGALGVHAVPNG